MIVPLRMLILAVVDAVIHDIGAEHSEHMIQLLCAGAAIRRIGKIILPCSTSPFAII